MFSLRGLVYMCISGWCHTGERPSAGQLLQTVFCVVDINDLTAQADELSVKNTVYISKNCADLCETHELLWSENQKYAWGEEIGWYSVRKIIIIIIIITILFYLEELAALT